MATQATKQQSHLTVYYIMDGQDHGFYYRSSRGIERVTTTMDAVRAYASQHGLRLKVVIPHTETDKKMAASYIKNYRRMLLNRKPKGDKA